jgi:hypothetical protein
LWFTCVGNAVPGVLYGVDKNKKVVKKNILIDKKEISRHINQLKISFENTLFDVCLPDGNVFQATPRQLQVHPGDSILQ